MIRAVIFDLFGVLINDALKATISGLRKTDNEKANRIVSLVRAGNKGAMDADASRQAVAGELGLTLNEYRDAIRNGEVRNVQLINFIKKLRNTYKTALLSNINAGGLSVRFTNDELAQYFDAVVASCDIGFVKPEAQAYEITADRLGVRLEECVMIDDLEPYCQGARGVGMQAIQYKTFEQMKREIELLIQ